jgi:glucose 1-dehydrogenase
MLLEGRKAIITGSSSGIGRSCAIRFSQEGADVCINYYSEHEAGDAEEVVKQVEANGRRAIAVQADVGNEDDVKRLVASANEAFGGLNVLVNNAGIENQVPTMEMSLKDWERVLRTNLTGVFLCMREAGNLMKDRGGAIVNMSSVHQFIPWPGWSTWPRGRSPRRSTTSFWTIRRPSTQLRRRSLWAGSASRRRSPPP